MARIRSIKPSVWTDDQFIELSRDARLLAIGMLSNADDDGRLIASPTALIGAIYPHDDLAPKTVEKWRDEVERAGIICTYRVGKAVYAYFPVWAGEESPRADYWTHQVINKRNASKLPVPTTGATTGVATDSAPSGSLPDFDFDSESEPGSRSRPTHQGDPAPLSTTILAAVAGGRT